MTPRPVRRRPAPVQGAPPSPAGPVGSAAVARVAGLALRIVLRGRYLLFIAVAAGWVVRTYGKVTRDWFLFEMAARIMLHGRGPYLLDGSRFHLYAEMPRLQFGPPTVAAVMPLQLLPIRVSHLVAYAAMMATGIVCIGVVERIAAEHGVPYRRRSASVLLGGSGFLFAWGILALEWMHVDDVLALLLVLVALWALTAARPHWVVAVVLLGTAGAAKPWAVLCWALILLVPRARRAVAALACLVTALAWWAPFVVAAPDTVAATGSVTVRVSPDSCLRLFGLTMDGASPPGHRLFQFGLGIAITAWVIHRSGRWDAALLVALLVRVATDTQTWPYYAAGPVLGAFLLDTVRGRRMPWLTVLTIGIGLAVPHSPLPPTAVGWLRLVFVVLVVALALRRPPQPGLGPERDGPGSQRESPVQMAAPPRSSPIGAGPAGTASRSAPAGNALIDAGYTLIEVLTVAAILAILAAIVIPNLVGQRGRAHDTATRHDVSVVARAVIAAFAQDGTAPTVRIVGGDYLVGTEKVAAVSPGVVVAGIDPTTVDVTGWTPSAWCLTLTDPAGSIRNFKFSARSGLESGACSSSTAP